MNNYDLDKRIIDMAHYILDNHTTIRATAKQFNISKSTVHIDLSVKLRYINPALHAQVKALLDENFSVKHIHGGESTKHKYAQLKSKTEDEFLDYDEPYYFGA